MADRPDLCVQVSLGREVQGWFLSATDGDGLELTLAMLSRSATVSGLLVYDRALAAYSERGARLGKASFSITNPAVCNIYSVLGARFLSPVSHWIWEGGSDPIQGMA